MSAKLHILTYTRTSHVLMCNLKQKVPLSSFKQYLTVCYQPKKYLQKQGRIKPKARIQMPVRIFSDNVKCDTTKTWSTIFSLSSGHGKCGVAVIRISGPSALHALSLIARMKHPARPREATVRKLIDPETGVVIDKGLVIAFPGKKNCLIYIVFLYRFLVNSRQSPQNQVIL